jgi:hypothetical protein
MLTRLSTLRGSLKAQVVLGKSSVKREFKEAEKLLWRLRLMGELFSLSHVFVQWCLDRPSHSPLLWVTVWLSGDLVKRLGVLTRGPERMRNVTFGILPCLCDLACDVDRSLRYWMASQPKAIYSTVRLSSSTIRLSCPRRLPTVERRNTPWKECRVPVMVRVPWGLWDSPWVSGSQGIFYGQPIVWSHVITQSPEPAKTTKSHRLDVKLW